MGSVIYKLCVSGKLLDFSIFQFPHENADNNVRVVARIKLVNILKTFREDLASTI